MNPTDARETYRRALGECETITIRRYYGSDTPRAKYETTVHARITGYAAGELVGPVRQGDRKAIVLAQDLETGSVTLPILVSDKAVVRGKELAIIVPDNNTRMVGSVLCALELALRG